VVVLQLCQSEMCNHSCANHRIRHRSLICERLEALFHHRCGSSVQDQSIPKTPARVNRTTAPKQLRRRGERSQLLRSDVELGSQGSRHSRSKIATRRLVLPVKGTTCAGCCQHRCCRR
jgi:hypothetical protein